MSTGLKLLGASVKQGLGHVNRRGAFKSYDYTNLSTTSVTSDVIYICSGATLQCIDMFSRAMATYWGSVRKNV